MSALTAPKRNGLLVMEVLLLSATAVLTLVVAPSRAATIIVKNQTQFDAAVATATETGHADTIDASMAGPIDPGTSLTLPGAATSINLELSTLGIGTTAGDETVTLGAKTTVSFGQPGNPGLLNMGEGQTGTLNINGASLIFNITDVGTQFNIGLDGGDGIVNMTSGSVTINDSNAALGVIGSISIGFPFGSTAASGTFNQSGGTVSVSAGALNIGVANGNGTYNLTNNAVLLDAGATVYIGASAGGVGVVNISGDATIDFESESVGFAGQLYVGDDTGVGTITQNGVNSTVILNVINIAQFGSNVENRADLGGIGTYNLLAGRLSIGGDGAAFGMDTGGIGIFNQSGGNLTANAPIYIGMSGNGTYNLSGGTATLDDGLTIAALAGSVGTVNQTGGVLTIAGGRLTVGGVGTATYNLNGGVLQAGGANGIVGTGSFNLGGGTIQVIGSALVTSVNATLTSGVSTIDTNGLGATFSGILSGNGGLAKVGAGTLVLTGTNSYAGGTDLNAGIIQVGADANLGAATGQLIFDGGTLQYANGFSSARSITLNTGGGIIDTNANNATLSGAIGGAGGLTKTGAGALTLSGASNYSGATLVNAGTLQAGATNVLSAISAFTLASGTTLNLGGFDNTIGSLAGSGSVALGAATLTAGGDGASTDFSGTIDGTGGLVKSGDGTLTLTGTSSYVGPTTVAAGTLDVNGTLASIATVDSGAILKGNGTLGGLAVASGGVVAPGNSIGTLNIAGNVAFASGSIYQVEANAAGAADKISASGVTTLGGGHVQVLAQSGNYTAQTYTILTSAAGVDGTFTDATSDLAFLTPTLSYDPDDVFLTLTRNGVFFSDMAETRNQRGVAGALDAAPTGDALVTAVGGQNPAGARQAFDALSGEIYASTASSLITDSVYFREAILGRLRQASFAGASDATAALGLGGPALAYADTAPASVGNVPFPIRSSRAPDLTWWSVGTGAWGQFDGDGNAAGVERNLAGYFTGVDRRFGDNWLAGLAAGYTNSSLSIAARASGADINTAHFAAYAAGNYDAWNFRSGAAFSWSDISTNRMVLFPGFSEATNTNYNAGTTQVFGEVGYARSLGNIAIEPFAGAAYVHLGTAGFTEAGQTAALSGASINEDVGYSSLGLRLATNIALESGQVLTPHASAYWQHAFGDVTPVETLSFLSTGTGFSTAGVPLAQNTAVIDTGLDLALTRNTKIGVSYFGQLGSNVQDNAVKGDFLWRF
ncbi:MAG: autotransporter domain-containing protein [Methylovirgula sp.]|uniref:autotransporter domain-containing protein n=1 Tax=Methylovirgula sp. TaxID=1978224 RepID=UPI0030764498